MRRGDSAEVPLRKVDIRPLCDASKIAPWIEFLRRYLADPAYFAYGARRGGQRAVIAIAHAQLIAIYWALRNGTPYPEQVQRLEQDRREAQIRYHSQKLTKLGYEPDMHG